MEGEERASPHPLSLGHSRPLKVGDAVQVREVREGVGEVWKLAFVIEIAPSGNAFAVRFKTDGSLKWLPFDHGDGRLWK